MGAGVPLFVGVPFKLSGRSCLVECRRCTVQFPTSNLYSNTDGSTQKGCCKLLYSSQLQTFTLTLMALLRRDAVNYCTVPNFKPLLKTLMALLRRDAVNYCSIPGAFAGESGRLWRLLCTVLACVACCWQVTALPVCITAEY